MPTLAEPHATALLLTIFGLLMLFSVLFTRTLDRVGVPVVLLFLLLGMLGGSEGLGGVAFDRHDVAFRLGTIALVLILFDGGLNTSRGSIRRSIGPAGLLSTIGVAGTAAVLALIGRLLGLSWTEALLIGVIVSSTDAAAVFAVLRGGSLRVKERVRSTLEVESCVNDPMAVILTVTLIDTIGAGAPGGGAAGFLSRLAVEVPLQLVIGAGAGVGVGLLTRWTLHHVRLSTAGLYPVITLASAFIAFGAATLAAGSGFLAVFACGAVLGNGALPFRAGLTRVHDAVAWMGQVSMFLMLGLLVFPSQLLPVAGVGLLLGLGLALVARPLVVTLCLLPFGWPAREIGYVAWVGIRGAVPIVLATFPVMAQIPGAERIFHVVFFIVVVSAIFPGASIVPLTRRLGLVDDDPPPPDAALEVHSRRHLGGSIFIYRIHPAVAACDALLSELRFPEGGSVLLVLRGDELMPARGGTRLQANDFVYVYCRPQDEAAIGLLLGQPLSD